MAEGVLLCEDVLAVPAEVLVRREALRDLCSCELWVVELTVDTELLPWAPAGSRGVPAGAVTVGKLSVGGEVLVSAREKAWEMEARAALCLLLGLLPPKMEGRREKKPLVEAVGVVGSAISLAVPHPRYGSGARSQG